MKRMPISAEALRILLNAELSNLTPCAGVEVHSLEILPVPDKHGCNWRVGSFSEPDLSEPCKSLVEVAVWSLQWRYLIAP